MPRSKSSKRWLKEHFSDEYVQAAKDQGYRSRAVFKLQQIQEKHRLIKPNMTVVDLGAAPGGWSQQALKWVGKNGRVVAMDILPMDPIEGIDIITGDFCEQTVFDQLQNTLQQEKAVDIVLSDMAPNMAGIPASDQARSMYLAELALDFAEQSLKKEGHFIIKLFQGCDFDEYIRALRAKFAKVVIYKPPASRDRSREVYAIAMGFHDKAV